jgi:hypothetical protein
MSNTAQRMILRRTGDPALSSAEAATRIQNADGVSLLNQSGPSALLVEGSSDRISAVVRELAGWIATPVKTYPVPDARPRVLKSPGS